MGILFKNMYFKRVTYARHQSGRHGGHEKKRNSPFSQPIPAPLGGPKPSGCPAVPSKIPLPIDSKQIPALA